MTPDAAENPAAVPPTSEAKLEHRPRLAVAGVLLLLALAVEIVTLSWSHPLAFVAFAAGGGLLTVAGVGLYLRYLLR